MKPIPKFDEKYAYEMGEDVALNGANTTNCHFALFSTNELMKAWEKGLNAGLEKIKND